jgi:hypothetical protein
MLFQMVEHSILPRCDFVAMRTRKEALVIPGILWRLG